MKILHVLWSATFGGIEQIVLDLVQIQNQQNNVEAEIMICKLGGEFQEKFENNGCVLHNIGLSNGRDTRVSPYRKAWKLFKKFDIIHLHQFHPLIANLATKSPAKVLFTEHGNFGFGREIRFSDKINSRFKKIFLNSRVDFISFNSNFTKRTSIELFGLEKTKYDVVYNGISQNHSEENRGQVDPGIYKKIENKFVIGTSSRFAGFKRIDRLIDGFHKCGRFDESVLLLVGDGILIDNLKEQVINLEIENQVIFAGYKENISAYQNVMDLCVFPSEREPFGLVAVEALSLGKPAIIFSDGGGLKEIVSPVEPKDVVDNIDELSQRLAYYFENRSEILNHVDARKTRAAFFNIEKMEKEFQMIYQSLM